MRAEQFETLVANLKRDRKLTSVPFAARDHDDPDDADDAPVWEVLSGNHRVKASIAADLDTIPLMVTEDRLSRQQKVAIQLSHNAIAGEDDPTILASLYEELQDVDWREYSGLDDKQLAMLEAVDLQGLSEANLDFVTTSIVFLPEERDRAREALDSIVNEVGADEAWVAPLEVYDEFMTMLQTAQSSFKVGNIATALMICLDIVQANLGAFQRGFLSALGEARHDGLVRLSVVLEDEYLPAPAAAVIKRALDEMVKQGDITPSQRARGVELVFADYLAGMGVTLD